MNNEPESFGDDRITRAETQANIHSDLHVSRIAQSAAYVAGITGGAVSAALESGHSTPLTQILVGTTMIASTGVGLMREHAVETARRDVAEYADQEKYVINNEQIIGYKQKTKEAYKSFGALALGAVGAHMFIDSLDFEHAVNTFSSPSFSIGAIATGASIILFQKSRHALQKLENDLSDQLTAIEDRTQPGPEQD